ncbi:hypothetical protein QBC42DRAFT_106655 [Cladorrhinum samala]|uniref:WW domain-containing protein n=1 Tax=Cladorrhinum samala TaxID=585594 RepID=A0AAV9HIE6_9PEZI|nr:hypothetical protein QBC42DRAFT_106655 [Cladorrhinum samala]
MSTPSESEKAATAPDEHNEQQAQDVVEKEEPETADDDATKETKADTSSPTKPDDALSRSPSPSDESSEDEEGEVSDGEQPDAPPLPNEPLPGDASAPPLPSEPLPEQKEHGPGGDDDDGWDCHWNPNDNSWWFYNRFTGAWQQENPRIPAASSSSSSAIPGQAPAVPLPPNTDKSVISDPSSLAGGYNPAIHGSYDENAWYAVNARAQAEQGPSVPDPEIAAAMLAQGGPGAGAGGGEYATGGYFNRHTGQWQMPEQGPEKHSDDAKSRRQMSAFFDVIAAANMHDGRSLKAERAGKKPSKKELREFKEKRRAKKEEKRRAWLKD